MIGLYPLDTHPTTFDMATWAVIAKTYGVDHVRFALGKKIAHQKYGEDLAWRRFGNIVVPICKLAGLTYSVSEKHEGREFPYLTGHANQTFSKFGTIAKLATSLPADRAAPYVTITIRQSFRNTFRNSNIEAWKRAQWVLSERGHRVVVLNECEESPLPVERRMQIYANAAMNLGVSNGPMALCHFSEAPYITLNMVPERPKNDPGYNLLELLEKSGFPFGSQFHFRNARQKLVWAPDTLDNIMNAFDEVMGNGIVRVDADSDCAVH